MQYLVAPPRLELGTQGSSGLCSTNWAKEPQTCYLIVLKLSPSGKGVIILYTSGCRIAAIMWPSQGWDGSSTLPIRTISEQNWKRSPCRAAFSRLWRSQSQIFYWGNEEIGHRLRRHFYFVFLGSTRRFRDTATFFASWSSLLVILQIETAVSIHFFIGSTYIKTPSEDCSICSCKRFFSFSISAWPGTVHALRRRQDSHWTSVAIC